MLTLPAHGKQCRCHSLLSRCFTSTENVWLIRDGGKWNRKREPRPTPLFTQLMTSDAANKRWPGITVLVERALLTIICQKRLSVTNHYLSQTVMSQTVICHKQLSVTNCYLSQTIICHKQLSVTNYYLSQTIICHKSLFVTNKC